VGLIQSTEAPKPRKHMGLTVWGLRFGAWVSGLGFRVSGLGFGVGGVVLFRVHTVDFEVFI